MFTGKLTNESKKKPEEKFDGVFGTISEPGSVFKEASKNFKLNFLLN
jgi:hypothetical protein